MVKTAYKQSLNTSSPLQNCNHCFFTLLLIITITSSTIIVKISHLWGLAAINQPPPPTNQPVVAGIYLLLLLIHADKPTLANHPTTQPAPTFRPAKGASKICNRVSRSMDSYTGSPVGWVPFHTWINTRWMPWRPMDTYGYPMDSLENSKLLQVTNWIWLLLLPISSRL